MITRRTKTQARELADVVDIATLSQALGNVQGKLDLLIAAVDKLDQDAESARAKVQTDVADIKSRLASVERGFAEIEPIVKRIESDRIKALGFVAGLSVAGGALGTKAVVLLQRVFGG